LNEALNEGQWRGSLSRGNREVKKGRKEETGKKKRRKTKRESSKVAG